MLPTAHLLGEPETTIEYMDSYRNGNFSPSPGPPSVSCNAQRRAFWKPILVMANSLRLRGKHTTAMSLRSSVVVVRMGVPQKPLYQLKLWPWQMGCHEPIDFFFCMSTQVVAYKWVNGAHG